MDRTAQLRGKCQSACKSHGSTCICRGTRQDPSSRRCCSANCTGLAAVNTWSPLEPRPATPRRRPWQKYRKPTGVISFVVPPPKSLHLRRTRRRTAKSLPRAEPKLDRPPARPRSLWLARHHVASSRRVRIGLMISIHRGKADIATGRAGGYNQSRPAAFPVCSVGKRRWGRRSYRSQSRCAGER
jgi:hypothetical protein